MHTVWRVSEFVQVNCRSCAKVRKSICHLSLPSHCAGLLDTNTPVAGCLLWRSKVHGVALVEWCVLIGFSSISVVATFSGVGYLCLCVSIRLGVCVCVCGLSVV